MQDGWKNQPNLYLSIYIFNLFFITFLLLCTSFLFRAFISCEACYFNFLSLLMILWETDSLLKKEKRVSGMKFDPKSLSQWWKGGVWNEVWSKIITYIFNFPCVCFLIYLHKFVYHHMHGMGLISDQASFFTPTFPCRSNQPQQDKGNPFFPSKWFVYLSDLSSLLVSMSFYVLPTKNILGSFFFLCYHYCLSLVVCFWKKMENLASTVFNMLPNIAKSVWSS